MHKNYFVSFLAVLAMVASLQSARAGDITGKVTLKGTPPPPIQIDFSDHTECGSLHPDVVQTRHYLVGKDNGLKNVFIFISKGFEGKKFTPPTTPVYLDQIKCAYQPYVFGMMVGQPLVIKDSDPCIHNVHAIPHVEGNEEFNLIQAEQGKMVTNTFAKPEIMIRFECSVHEWMFAFVGVVDNPYYAVSDADGNFKIADVPPGQYTLTAFHPKASSGTPGISQSVKIDGTSPVVANFTVEVPQMKKSEP